ncbi:MAG: hypothetical protein N2Z79_02195, partial [Candidatus Omnitrophica bacterium]|nr:hypothetical protein [Candidatus Omnitrophota bacterium]
KALEEQSLSGEFLGKIILKHRWIKEKDLLLCLAEQFGISFITLKDKYIDWRLFEEFSPSLILDYRCIPLKKEKDKIIFVINNPLDILRIKKIEEETKGLRLELVVALEEEIEEVISRFKEHLRSRIA